MSIWVVRAGSYGEQEQGAIDNNVVTIGWNELPDLSKIKSREELTKLYTKVNPGDKKMTAANAVGQIWRFVHEIKKDDLVALPLKTQSSIALGTVAGDYEYRKVADNIIHIRSVKWLKTIPRSAFDQDILYSLGSLMTVCKVSRNNAEQRIKRLLKESEVTTVDVDSESTELEETVDIETNARDQIVKYIGQKFTGHNLVRLVEVILHAQGYITIKSPPGPDGGVDILAALGALGFDKPKVCVQVKSSSSQIDVNILRELRGVMSGVGAEQGLLIAWGGYSKSCLKEARDAFFTIRLWDQGDLLDAVFKYYDQFDDELKAELPLKKIWALVSED